MPTYICKIEKDRRPLYFNWSTIVDAPVSYAVPLEEFERQYRLEHGESGMRDLPERIARANATGTSSRAGETLAQLVEGNRAGEHESSLTLEQIIDYVCGLPAR